MFKLIGEMLGAGRRPAARALYDRLYPGHISLNEFQRLLLSAGASVQLFVDHSRDDLIATLGETTGECALRRIRTRMMANPVGQRILAEEPRIKTTSVDYAYLRQLPPNTLGKHYANFMDRFGLDADARRDVTYLNSAHLRYVMQRYREVHDLYHVMLGMPTNTLGETTVKVFEALQLGLPMTVLASVGGPFRLGPKHRARFFNEHLPWAVRNGLRAELLMNCYFEREWQTDIALLRSRLLLEEPLVVPAKAKPAAGNPPAQTTSSPPSPSSVH